MDPAAVLFVGPSMTIADRASLTDFEVRPPIQRGDIQHLLDRPDVPGFVGIIDGRFLQALSVSPREVVAAHDRGIRLFGSSSMGALRAAECAPLGAMEGVGRIFAEYDSGRCDADDEVALTYDEETGLPLSEPLVSIRLNVAEAVTRGRLSTREAGEIMRVAKALYFPYRSYDSIAKVLTAEGLPQEAAALAETVRDPEWSNHKRLDALALVGRMRAEMRSESRASRGLAHRGPTGLLGTV